MSRYKVIFTIRGETELKCLMIEANAKEDIKSILELDYQLDEIVTITEVNPFTKNITKECTEF